MNASLSNLNLNTGQGYTHLSSVTGVIECVKSAHKSDHTDVSTLDILVCTLGLSQPVLSSVVVFLSTCEMSASTVPNLVVTV